jgi:hypothetical protein
MSTDPAPRDHDCTRYAVPCREGWMCARCGRPTQAPRAALGLHPFCNVCGWRKGGVDSWNGRACKCGLSEPMMGGGGGT